MDNRVVRIVARYLKQSTEMNLLTNYDDTLLAMAELEGEGWLNRQLHATEDTALCVPRALKYVRKKQQEISEDEEDLKNETDPEEKEWLKRNIEKARESNVTGADIYGSGGYHRYFVRPDGTVTFSAGHATLENIAKAKALGFETWGAH